MADIVSKPSTQAYRDGWERAFGRKRAVRSHADKRLASIDRFIGLCDQLDRLQRGDAESCPDRMKDIPAEIDRLRRRLWPPNGPRRAVTEGLP